MPIFIKGIHVDAKKPVVCVPVTEPTAQGIYDVAQAYMDAGVRMIEWRIDRFENYTDEDALRETLDILREMTKETILLATVRTARQGGCAESDGITLAALYDTIAQAHAADIIDVEAYSFFDPTAVIRGLHERGALVLLSQHDFSGTPSDDEMDNMLNEMARMDGDLVKLAVMPHEFSDTLRLMRAADRFRKACKNMPFIAIAMGKEGMLSRITGGLTGSCVTFAAGTEASAPGQLPFAEVQTALNFVDRYL